MIIRLPRPLLRLPTVHPSRLLAPVLLTGTLALAAAAPAHAQSRTPVFELGAGVSLTRDNDTTPVVAADWLPRWREFAGGQLHWETGLLHVRGRGGSRLDNDHDVTLLHGGLRYERPSGLVGGFGIGVQAGETEALSGGPQFISTLGWRWGRFSLLARHVSNASLHQPNDGETLLQGAWRF